MFFGNFTHTLLAWIWRNQGAQGVWSGFNCIRFIGNTPKVIIHIRTTCFLKHPKIAFLAIFAIFDHLIPQLWAKMANCRQIPRVPKCFPLQSAYNEQPRSRVRWRNSIVTIVWPPLMCMCTWVWGCVSLVTLRISRVVKSSRLDHEKVVKVSTVITQ